jgi:creatinine amidohydrolase
MKTQRRGNMGLLQDMKWKDVQEELKQTSVALVPIGSTEQHGYHMPMGSDTYCAFEIARRTAEKEKALVVPAIPYGISHCHMSFPGTVSLHTHTLFCLLNDICESLFQHGVDKFIMVNGHGHNNPTLQTFIDEFKSTKQAYFFIVQWWIAGFKLTPDLWSADPGDLPDGHAADVEASGMLAINSDLVDLNKTEKVTLGTLGKSNIKFNKSTSAQLIGYPVDLATVSDFKDLTESGVIGSSLDASKTKGEIVLDKVSDFLAELTRQLKAI